MSWSPGSLPFDVMRSGANLTRDQRAVLLACITLASPSDWTDLHRGVAAQAADEPETAGVVTASTHELAWVAHMMPKPLRRILGELVDLGLLVKVGGGRGQRAAYVVVDRAVRRLRQAYPGRKARTRGRRALRPEGPKCSSVPQTDVGRSPEPQSSVPETEALAMSSVPGTEAVRSAEPNKVGPRDRSAPPITRVTGQDDQNDQTPDPSSGLEGKEPRDGIDAPDGLPVSAGLLDSQPDLGEPSGRSFPTSRFADALGVDAAELQPEPEPEPVALKVSSGFGAALAHLTPAAVSKPMSRPPSVEPAPQSGQSQAQHVEVAKLRGPQLLSALKAAEAQLAHDGDAHGPLVTALGRMAHDVEDLLRGPVDPVGLRQLVESHRPQLDAAVDEHNGEPLEGLPTRDRYAFADQYALRVWEVCTQITWALSQETTAA